MDRSIDRKVLNSYRIIFTKVIKNLYPKLKLSNHRMFENRILVDMKVSPLDFGYIKIDSQKLSDQVYEILTNETGIESLKLSKNDARKYFEQTGEIYREQQIYSSDKNKFTFTNLSGFKDVVDEPIINKIIEVKSYSFHLDKIYSIEETKGKDDRDKTIRFFFLIFRSEADKYKYLEKTNYIKEYNHVSLNKKRRLFRGAYLKGNFSPYLLETPSFFVRKLSEYIRKEYLKMRFHELIFLQKPTRQILIDLFKNEIFSYKELPLRRFIFKSVYSQKKISKNNKNDLLNSNIRLYDCGFSLLEGPDIQNELFNYLGISVGVLRRLNLDWSLRVVMGSNHLPEVDLKSLLNSLNNYVHTNGVVLEVLTKDSQKKHSLKVQIVVKNKYADYSIIFSEMNYYGSIKDLKFISQKNKITHPHLLSYFVIKDYLKLFVLIIESNKGLIPAFFCNPIIFFIPVDITCEEYAIEVQKELDKVGVHGQVDFLYDLPLGKRLKKALIREVPYIIILGESEVKTKTMKVRLRNNISLGMMSVEEFKERIISDLRF